MSVRVMSCRGFVPQHLKTFRSLRVHYGSSSIFKESD